MPKPRCRAVLAYLLLSANRMVTTDSLIDALWGDIPPATARNQIQLDISAIRRTLRQARLRDPIDTTSTGYRISLDQDELDLTAFEDLRQSARALSEMDRPSAAADVLREALDLWRGQPLGDVAGAFVGAAQAALIDRYLNAVEDWAELELCTGRHRAIVPELTQLARQHPLREGISRQFALALYRDGRPAEALVVLRNLRSAMAEELGLDISPALAELEVSILRADPHLHINGPTEPVAAGAPRVNALPRSVTTFTGRDSELHHLDRLVTAAEASLITVTGAGGIGKTALVLHWAHSAASRFPDGLLYVDLRGFSQGTPLSTIEALSRLLHQFGVAPVQIPVHEEHAVDLYRARLSGKRALVVLDNARDSDQVRPLLPGGAGCSVIVTSRTRLSGLVAREGAAPIDLDVFSPGEARVLLDTLLGPQDEEEVDELARICAYVPLALRIAAASVPGGGPRGLANYLDRMRSTDRLDALRLEGDDHTAMATTLMHSYELLEPAARRLFRLLSLIPGPDFTVVAVADLAGSPGDEAHGLLMNLVAVHLVEERAPGRFGFHDLLRLFSTRQAEREESANDRHAALDRLYAHYLMWIDAAARRVYPQVLRLPFENAGSLVVPSIENAGQALAWLDAERHNLVAAVTQGCQEGPRRLAWSIADGLRGYYYLRLFTVDWLAVGRAALGAAQRQSDDQAEAAAHLSLADLRWRQGDYAAADTAYDQAIRHAAQADWPAGQATALGNLGGLRRMQGRLAEAVSLLERALALNVEIGRIEGELVNLGNLGIAYGELGDWRRAEDYLVRAHAIGVAVGSQSAQAVSLSNLVDSAVQLGEWDSAQQRLQQALALHRVLGDKAAEASTMRSEALIRQGLGDVPAALNVAQAAVALAEESEDARVLAHCLHVNAAILDATGHSDRALELAERGAKLAHDAGHRFVETRVLLGLAEILYRRGEPDQALTWARQAFDLAQGCGYAELLAEVTQMLTDAEAATR